MATASDIPTRAQLEPADTWDLSQLFASDADWERAFTRLDERHHEISRFKGRLGENAATLREALELEKSLDLELERLHHYASLRKAEDSADDANLDRSARIGSLLTRIAETSSFMTPEIMAIPDDDWQCMLADPQLDDWRNRLEKTRRYKPHTLGESEERLLAMGAEPLAAARQAFGQLTNVDMDFGSLADENGDQRKLTQSSFSSFLNMRDPQLRRDAFHQFYHQFAAHRYTLAAMLAGSVKSDVFSARARNFGSALERALFPDRMPTSVYHNLVDTVRGHFEPLHRYYELRRRALALPEIHHYDTYVPIVAEIERITPWDDAVGLLLEALAPLGREYTSVLAGGLRGRWADRYESKGKRSGAFSSSSYGNPPYILMNYKPDVFADVYTLAHEAGHSMHSWYSQRHQLFQDYDYPIFTAEVASTFNEELLTHHLLEHTSDPRMRAYLVNRQIDDIRATLYRQTMFAEFEREIHSREERGEAVTLDWMRATYRQLLEAYFGGQFSIDDELELECLRIPHFYSAFYVYKYATGVSAAISLSRRVLGGGQAEVDDYLGFLKSGGSRYPLETLTAAGVDMSSPQPIQQALALFSQRVDELESLLGQLDG